VFAELLRKKHSRVNRQTCTIHLRNRFVLSTRIIRMACDRIRHMEMRHLEMDDRFSHGTWTVGLSRQGRLLVDAWLTGLINPSRRANLTTSQRRLLARGLRK